jgi:hypothetical protein
MASCNNSTCFITASEARSNARNNSLVFQEICAIQQAILAAIDAHQFDVVIADGTPMTSVNEIQSVVVTNPGSGYSTFTATASVVHPNGTGAIISPIISGTTVSGFTVIDGGSGYEPILASADASGIGNGDAVIQVIAANDGIAEANILVPGTNYNVGFTIPVTHPTGVNAVVTISQVDLNGAITELTIDNPGTGYDPIVGSIDVVHPTGVGFDAIPVVLGGVVTDVFINYGGEGYGDLKPTATLVNPTGAGAEFDVTLSADQIASVEVVNGGAGYSDPTDIVINDIPGGTGTGATALTVVDASEYSSTDYYNVWQGLVTDPAIQDQLDSVISYYQKLGYNIRIETNTNTSDTIQWHIFW